MKNKTILGLTEHVTLISSTTNIAVKARIDSGATYSSMDAALAKKLGCKILTRKRKVRNVHGITMRKMVQATIMIAGNRHRSYFTIADRSTMKYKVLIGQNTLKNRGYLIDPDKK